MATAEKRAKGWRGRYKDADRRTHDVRDASGKIRYFKSKRTPEKAALDEESKIRQAVVAVLDDRVHRLLGQLVAQQVLAFVSTVVVDRGEWVIPDDGATWERDESVTAYSRDKWVRPTTPEGHFPGCPEVAWMAGWYVSFAARYNTRIVYRP